LKRESGMAADFTARAPSPIQPPWCIVRPLMIL